LVAFLDSDDEWEPDHLRNALEAFHSGCDFYFSDHLDYSGETTRFGRFHNRGTFRACDHPKVRPGSSIRWFSGDFVDQLLREFVVSTPTVVLRRSLLVRHRFPIQYRRSGEDHLLWLQIAASGAKVAFSEKVECILGKGVNIFEGSGWGTDGAFECSVDFFKMLLHMSKKFAETEEQKKDLSRRLSHTRRECIRILIHDIAHGRVISARDVWRHLRNDPLTLAVLFPETIRIMKKKLQIALRGSA
jgi:succinoglycan biosynthesis protein ExoW